MSQQLIIGSVAIAVVDTVVTDLQATQSKGPSFRIVIGGFVVLVTLLAISETNEQLADGFAVAILLATLIGPKGGALTKLVTKLTKPGYTPPLMQQPGYTDPNAVFNLDPAKRG